MELTTPFLVNLTRRCWEINWRSSRSSETEEEIVEEEQILEIDAGNRFILTG
jgi:hypothetical protein